MKRFLWLLIFIPFIIAAKISDYTEDTSPTSDDYILTVDQTSGSNKKVQLGNLPSSSGFTDDGTTVHNTTITDNVGIGTTTASSKLTVAGTITVSGSVQATSFVGDGSGLTGVSAGWTDGGSNVYTSTTTDNVGIGTTTPSTTLEVVKQGTSAPLMISSTATGDGDYLIVDSAGNVGIGTTLTSNAAVSIMNGNVGIGTTKPRGMLQIGKDAVVAGAIPTNIMLGLDFSSTPAQNLKINLYPGGSGNDWGFGISSGRLDYVMNGSSTNTHSFYYNTTQLMDIRGTGNVGIGTFGINTTARLAVQGAGTTTGKNFETRNSSGTALVTMLDSGNVGLGSTSPNGAFVIRTSANDIGWSKQSAANQACNTTCTSSCVFGQNTGDMSIVDCADATADVCVCAGSN